MPKGEYSIRVLYDPVQVFDIIYSLLFSFYLPHYIFANNIYPLSIGVFGPNDRMIVEASCKNRSYAVFWNIFIDFIYVGNVSYGHLLAEKGLMERTSRVGGQAYLISNNEPVEGSEWAARLHYHNPT